MKCNPPCTDCPIPYTCGMSQKNGGATVDSGLQIEMYDPPLPTLFEVFDSACDWVRFYFVRIVAACAAVGFLAGVYFTYFWS